MKKSVSPVFAYLYEEPDEKTRVKVRIATVISSIVLAALLIFVLYRFYATGQFDSRYWFFFARWTTWSFILRGLLGTLEASLLGGAFAFIFGFCMMYGRTSKIKIFNIFSTVLIEFTRGVPTLLFIYFFFLALPAFGIKMLPILNISLPVAISASGIVAEVLRTGINSVPRGQTEAALSLGFSDRKAFIQIVFPQAFRYVIPSLISELVIVVKDTTFAYIISYPDLMQNAKVLISNYDSMLSVYIFVAVVYILINYLLNRLSIFIAQKGVK